MGFLWSSAATGGRMVGGCWVLGVLNKMWYEELGGVKTVI